MIFKSSFKPAWWLKNAHGQTLWPNRIRRGRKVKLIRQRFELNDGDFLDTEWTPGSSGPIILILHGLEGSTRSGYAVRIMRQIHKRGWRGAFMYYRSCSGEPNRLHRRYHAGDTADLTTFLNIIKQREPDTPIGIVGYSLGGNVLLKWLAESQQIPSTVAAAVAVSVPFELHKVNDRLTHGFSRVYQAAMRNKMQRSIKEKYALRTNTGLNIDAIVQMKTFREIDEAFTAPVHGFSNVDEYYLKNSSRYTLKDIKFPTLVLHACDDPFMTMDAVPSSDELSNKITFELSEYGGHVGFVYGNPWRPRYYLEERIPNYLENRIRTHINQYQKKQNLKNDRRK